MYLDPRIEQNKNIVARKRFPPDRIDGKAIFDGFALQQLLALADREGLLTGMLRC
jgi:hypothetical protein